MATVYRIEKMRVILPTEKQAEKHPDRFATVLGVFYAEDGSKLSITSKVIDKDVTAHTDFKLDLKKGILTLPSGERGRRAAAGATEAEILSALNALREAD